MLRKLLLVLGFVGACAAVALPTAAQPRGGPGDDAGGEGSGGRPHRQRLFISPSGEPFRGRGGLEAWFAQADADHDGAITPAEFQADAERAFRLYDADSDGVIDGLETQAYERDRVPEIAEIAFPGDGAGGGMGRGRHGGHRRQQGHGGDGQAEAERDFFAGVGQNGAARFSLLDEPEPLLAADTDVDGKVTRKEWAAATARRFAELDRGHAGKLTLEALKARSKR